MIEIRFKKTDVGEIPEDWEIRTLGSVCRVNGRIGFRGYTTEDLVKEGEGAYTIGGKHITNNYLDLKNPEFISWEKYYESPEIMLKKGDIVIAQRGSLGKSAIINYEIGPATINPSLVLLNKINCNNYYLNYFLHSKTALNYVFQSNGLTSIPMISQKQIEQMPLVIPSSLREQQRIATALNDIDTLLSVLDKKIEKKKNIKQGVMQQLLTGKKRLAGFTRPWVKKNIAEICTIKARIGWQGLKTDEYLDYGNYVLITGTDFENGGINWLNCSFVSKERFEQDENIKIKQGDVLITKDGSIGKVAYLDFIPMEGTLNSGVFVVRPKDISHLNNNYLALFFKSKFFEDFISQLKAGSTIVHLYQKDFIRLQLNYPNDLSEQAAIVTIFSDMDREIEALEAKRGKYEQVKQGMMQQLLTGKIRLID